MSERPDPTDEQLGAEFGARRPEPGRDFGDRLRDRLTGLEAEATRPARLRLLVSAYLTSGAVVLVLAALGATGHGLFA